MGIEGERRQKTKVLILGIDGYIGWPLANHLKRLGYEVRGVDDFSRRALVRSLVPIETSRDRERYFDISHDWVGELTTLGTPDVIVHLAEMPSAPYSMASRDNAIRTQERNVIGTLRVLWLMREQCPDAHLVKLGTMGEYGTPECRIPEGFISGECLRHERIIYGNGDSADTPSRKARQKALSYSMRSGTNGWQCPMKGLPFPRSPGSFYHLSKVFDSMNIEFACRMWGLRSTDIMQGIVFGHMDGTRFDYDEHFGTVINRFCAQAVAGMPLTVYGKGGQTRGFLPLKDSIQCLTLAIENPPKDGEYRVFNQFAQCYSVKALASIVQTAARTQGMKVEMELIDNPRKEAEEHIYLPAHDKLAALGYQPNWNIYDEIGDLLETLKPFKDSIDRDVIMPKTRWR